MDSQKFMQECVARGHQQPTIRIGSTGPAVALWQNLLNKEIGSALRVDGVFGSGTHTATLGFQRKVGLRADGAVGTKTWAAAMVAPCYAAVLAQQQQQGKARGESARQMERQAAHGFGALDLSFSVLDTKSMILGAVIGIAAGAVLFGRK
jgi:peptidoglycan hydrolase-like protein with peptidoglycan-binding domain